MEQTAQPSPAVQQAAQTSIERTIGNLTVQNAMLTAQVADLQVQLAAARAAAAAQKAS